MRGRLDKLFDAWLAASLCCLITGSLWLFLSNVTLLVPPGGGGSEVSCGVSAAGSAPRSTGSEADADSWRLRPLNREFAGGLWHRADFWRCLWISLFTSTITALVAALVGIPAAWAMSRNLVPFGAVMETVFTSVIVLPASTVGLALIVLFQYGPLRRLQDWLGFSVMYSIFPGIVLAQLVLALAFGLSAWKAAFDAVDPRLENVAGSLGASPWTGFALVTFPMARSGLMAGFILAWIRAMAEFGAVLLFCGTFRELPLSRFGPVTRLLGLYKADILSIAMWTEIEYGNVEYGFGMAFALAVACAVSVYSIHRLGGKGLGWSG